jgi:hypothetical protein
MSLLTHQLSIKRYQKELGLDDRKFNALDVKYSDINLLKQLQILNPVIVAPTSAPSVPAPTASITTTNANIVNGNSTTITPVFTNATTKTINGNTTVEGQAITSTVAITVYPTTTTTYTLLITNSVGATAQDSVVINVSQPPPPANTGWYGYLNIVNQDAGYGGRYFGFSATDATGTIDVNTEVEAGTTYPIHVPIGNRLPNMN